MNIGAYEIVKTARSTHRPTGYDYVTNLTENFFELHGDRRFSDDLAIIGGLGYLKGRPVTMIAIDKGHTLKERTRRSFGAPNPEGYRKALRLMKQAEKFHRPVICLIDTSGAYCGIGAEERGQGLAIAENLMEMMTLKTPVISILTGEGGSGGALALAVADRVWMLENAIYSVISPEGCASILWKDASKAPQAAEQLQLTAENCLKNGIVEEVLSEENLGEASFYQALADRIDAELAQLTALSTQDLLDRRYQRFRAMGTEVQE